MKKRLVFIILSIIYLFIIGIGCSKSYIIDFPETRSYADTSYVYSVKGSVIDTTETSGIPVSFDVIVEEWEDS
jgi:hypothetical protein